MKVGDFVRNEHHGLQRYGKVKKVLKNPKGDKMHTDKDKGGEHGKNAPHCL